MDNFIGALRICLQFPDAASVLPKVLRGDKLDKGSEKPRRRDPWMALKYITAMGGMKMRYARAFMRRVIITLVRLVSTRLLSLPNGVQRNHGEQ